MKPISDKILRYLKGENMNTMNLGAGVAKAKVVLQLMDGTTYEANLTCVRNVNFKSNARMDDVSYFEPMRSFAPILADALTIEIQGHGQFTLTTPGKVATPKPPALPSLKKATAGLKKAARTQANAQKRLAAAEAELKAAKQGRMDSEDALKAARETILKVAEK